VGELIMTKERGSKGARSFTSWHKHKRPTGKRMIAKSRIVSSSSSSPWSE
jgi:hypothetical protein